MLRKKFTAVAMSAVLAVSLCPGLAVAAPLTGGSVATSAKTTQTVKTQAKKSTVYVLTDFYETAYSGVYYNQSDGAQFPYDKTVELSTDPREPIFTYNANGLLTSNGSEDLTYKGVNLKSIVKHVDPTETSVPDSVYKYSFKSKKGLVKSETYTNKHTDAADKYSDSKYTSKYTYDKKGNLTKSVDTSYRWNYGTKFWNKLKKTGTTTTTLTLNKKGLPSKSNWTSKSLSKQTTTSATTKYSYDKKKNLKKAVTPSDQAATTYKYSGYKKGVPTALTVTTKAKKRLDSGQVVTDTYTTKYALTYTPVKVSKSYAPVVKRQQWALLNGTDLNGAFGDVDLSLDLGDNYSQHWYSDAYQAYLKSHYSYPYDD